MPYERVVSFADSVSVRTTVRDSLTGDVLLRRETIFGKNAQALRCVAAQRVATGYTQVEIQAANSSGGYETVAMATDDPNHTAYYFEMLGWVGDGGAPIEDLLTLCRTTLFETVYTINP